MRRGHWSGVSVTQRAPRGAGEVRRTVSHLHTYVRSITAHGRKGGNNCTINQPSTVDDVAHAAFPVRTVQHTANPRKLRAGTLAGKTATRMEEGGSLRQLHRRSCGPSVQLWADSSSVFLWNLLAYVGIRRNGEGMGETVCGCGAVGGVGVFVGGCGSWWMVAVVGGCGASGWRGCGRIELSCGVVVYGCVTQGEH